MVLLPEKAEPGDPKWAVAYLELAHGMVMAGAKAKLIERYTGLPHRQVSKIYKALRGTMPPSGPVMYGSAEHFALRSAKTSAAWVIQCGIFLECYDRMQLITPVPLQRGWRLLAALRAYLAITEKLNQTCSLKRLDINQAYALLTHSAFLSDAHPAQVQRRRCPVCLLRYPVVASRPLHLQDCPVCAINAHSRRDADRNTGPTEKRARS